MKLLSRLPSLPARTWVLLACLIHQMLLPAAAQDGPDGPDRSSGPGARAARAVQVDGGVTLFDPEAGRWVNLERNRPLAAGDRLVTAAGAQAELRLGSTVLRLAERTELELAALDGDQVLLRLHAGSLALRLNSREATAETRVVTNEALLRPQRSGHYRFDRMAGTTWATPWRGELRVEGPGGWGVAEGQRLELYRDAGGELRGRWGAPPDDAFAAWVQAEDAREGRRVATAPAVSPEITGVEELERHGRWATHPEFGAIWFPLAVAADWAPFRDGRWVWLRPWGWTWIDDAPWGFAPSHYGRWVHWEGRWGWLPGRPAPRPFFRPAPMPPPHGFAPPHPRPPHEPERPRRPPPAQAPLLPMPMPMPSQPPRVQPPEPPRQHLPAQPWREHRSLEPREMPREVPREVPRESPRETPREPPRARPDERPRSEPRVDPRPEPRAPAAAAPAPVATPPAPPRREEPRQRRPEARPTPREAGENVR